MTTPTDPMEKRVGSVGKLLPHVEAKVVSTHDRTQILPIGEKGELVVAGYNVMKGYWGDKDRTEEVRVVERVYDDKGEKHREKVWMHTGDEAEMDELGYVKITGRIKDLIIRGGENIHPLEVENVLFMHEAISEASVVGLPDERYGECVAAFIVTHHSVRVGLDDALEGDSSIDNVAGNGEGGEGKVLTRDVAREWVREKLSNHLVPKYVFWVKEYPKTASGKIQKFKLREMGLEMLKGAEIRRQREKVAVDR
jgi:acyl-CoA synthetase (AMP-forming)/AMP-acid ligase II